MKNMISTNSKEVKCIYAEHVQTNDMGEKQKELHKNICDGACMLFTYLFHMS